VEFSFSDHRLDVERRELRRGAQLIAVQPQVLDLLIYLIQNRDRVVSRKDLIGSVWGGRTVSESTLATRVNAVRKAIGDSGEKQGLIRTVPRKGFRFVADVEEHSAPPEGAGVQASRAAEAPSPDIAASEQGAGALDDGSLRISPHGSIAVLPFADVSVIAATQGGVADALVYDVITRLAKLRRFVVIAQGTVFALRERRLGPRDSGRFLNVDYVVTGIVRRVGQRLAVTVELLETHSARIVWAEAFDRPFDDVFAILSEIGDSIVASINIEVRTLERNRAILKPPDSLDAWEAHHRALWHMYRFNKADNEQARHFFEMATRLDPTFARAYAGLSFTHLNNAVHGWAERKTETERAYATAGQSLMADDRDPASHWAMGRALWLRGRFGQSVAELNQAVDLSPNYFHAHYSLAFVQATTGDPTLALSSADYSHRLSPYDPMLFASLAVRALALARLGRFEEAADFGARAAARPNAHEQALAVAAYTAMLAGRRDEARTYLAQIHQLQPGYGVEDMLSAFQLGPQDQALFRGAASGFRDEP
jgi:TolB-like protein/DNA-binding winged helix-turn-helix (wHTH) protein/Tfp pilus assembly protein PilF